MEKHNGETGQQAEESGRTEKEEMKKYKIRKNSILENAIIFAACGLASAIMCLNIIAQFSI